MEGLRKIEGLEIKKRYASAQSELVEAETRSEKATTRWELVKQLDKLEVALKSDDLEREREIIRALLVANEANLKIKDFDFLGGLYLDLLRKATFDKSDMFRVEVQKVRSRILQELEKILRERPGFVKNPGILGLFAGTITLLLWFLWGQFYFKGGLSEILIYRPIFIIVGITSAILAGFLFIIPGYIKKFKKRRFWVNIFSKYLSEDETIDVKGKY